jgi:hypothetical protein
LPASLRSWRPEAPFAGSLLGWLRWARPDLGPGASVELPSNAYLDQTAVPERPVTVASAMSRSLVACLVVLCSHLAPAVTKDAAAQEVVGRPRVFFDCDGPECSSQYYRTEIAWVDWVNDRQVADLHLIMSSVRTGVGGREYQLDLIGVEAYEDYLDQMRVQALPTDTERERLDMVTNAMAIGFARFAAVSGFPALVSLQGIDTEGRAAPDRVVSAQDVEDPWNLWVFRINARADLEGESLSKEQGVFSSINASRVTPTWKLNLNANVNYSKQEYELDDGTFSDTRYDWGVRPYVVYALADHWSVGLRGEVARFVRFNQRLRWELTPALEYSFFPYQEATRRALTVSYRVGPAYREYFEETVYLHMSELRWEHGAEIDLAQRQRWGEARASITASQFLFLPNTPLYEDGLYNVSLRGGLEVRIVRGLSVDLGGNISWVQDQIYLSAEGVTDEEALLRLQQQETDFQYGAEVGLSIQFGSIFNNVVNNRFNEAQGFGGRRF